MRTYKHIISLVLGLICISAGATPAHASEIAKESKVKAAILYNLARFSEWPEDGGHTLSADKFNVCTLTNVDMRDAMNDLQGKDIHGRELDITHLATEDDISTDCQVLYVSEAYISDNTDIETFDLGLLTEQGILTVGDTPDFLEFGGCISIQRNGTKLRFSINEKAMETANIKPSSKILRLSVTNRQ